MLPIILLLACNPEPADVGDDSGQSLGDDGMPDGGCVEVGRSPVKDPSVAAPGFVFSAAETLAIAVGSFTGTATLRDGATDRPPVAASFSVGPPTDLQAIDMEVDEGGSETGVLGAPEAEACPDYYEGRSALTLATEDGALAEASSAALVLWEATRASTGVELDLAALGGTYLPDFDPAKYDQTVLSLSATTAKGGWQGELQWSASRKIDEHSSQGVVGPAGSFSVLR